VLVDLVSREGETLEEYRARQALDADQNWTCVHPESKCAIKAHMGTYDFSESLSCWKEMGERAGFSTVECVVTSKFDLARVLVYRV